MKLYSLLLFSLLSIMGGIGDIAKINEYKGLAENAFKEGRYEESVNYYRYLIDTLGENDPGIRLNLGHAYYQTKQADKAMELYSSLSAHEDKGLRAKANNQLGIIHTNQQKLKEALEFFKASLRADPANEGTRYNYELVKKLLEEQEKKEQEKKDQQQKDQNEENKDEQKQDQEQKEQEKKEQEQQEQEQKDKGEQGEKKDGEQQEPKKGEENEENKEEQAKEQQAKQQEQRMKEINMSEDRAKMLLEAMKNQEMQYYQQLKKKTKPRKETRDKPDW